MKTFFKILLFILLLAVPFGVRYFLYFGLPNDSYQPPSIVTPDVSAISASPLTYQTYADQPKAGNARVLVDMAHRNNLLVDDLTPLQERLAARGISVRLYDYDSDVLSEELRNITTFIVVAPTRPFYLEEITAVKDFVARGGRLLLVADPTRSVPADDYYGSVDLYSLFFPESAVPAINSLANRFGIQFFEDYLYNLKDYQVNYRNVKITDFATDPLTAGLDSMILFAAHSLQSDGKTLLAGGADTLSNVRTGENALAAAVLSSDGNVLALGDLTILTAPSHRAADNDRFLSNLADWLAEDGRTWSLEDFPYLFSRPVELLAVSEQPLSPAVLNLAGPVQSTFTQAGLTFSWSQTPTAGHDRILAGLFKETQPISDVLASAGISVTLVTEDDANSAEPTEEVDAAADTADVEEETPEVPAVSTLNVAGMGVFELEGLQLFLVTHASDSTSLTILAADRDSLALAVERLVYRDFSGCSTQGGITLCASDAYAEWTEPVAPVEETPVPDGLVKVLILSIDESSGAGRTSVDEWLTALEGLYDVTVWSMWADGTPVAEDLAGYDAYIIDTGDYAYDSATMSQVPIYLIEGNWLLIGEQPGDPVENETATISDLTISQSDHPLVEGFPLDEPVILLESESGVPALVLTPPEEPTDGIEIVLARGDGSAQAGAPALITYELEETSSRFALAGFAFHRLPEELRATFAINVINWLANQ